MTDAQKELLKNLIRQNPRHGSNPITRQTVSTTPVSTQTPKGGAYMPTSAAAVTVRAPTSITPTQTVVTPALDWRPSYQRGNTLSTTPQTVTPSVPSNTAATPKGGSIPAVAQTYLDQAKTSATPQTITPTVQNAPEIAQTWRDLPTQNPVSETLDSYMNKMAANVGSAFANAAGYVYPALASSAPVSTNPFVPPSIQKQHADTLLSQSAKEQQQSLYGISDTLAQRAQDYQTRAEEINTSPILREAANVVTDLAPFFALNAIPVVGTAASAAYSVGLATGSARRAGMSDRAQTVAAAASLVSMKAAGQVGKVLSSESVTKWFLTNGKGPELVRLIEQSAVRGAVTGTTRQAASGAVKAAGGFYQEQVDRAQESIDALNQNRDNYQKQLADIQTLISEQVQQREQIAQSRQTMRNTGMSDNDLAYYDNAIADYDRIIAQNRAILRNTIEEYGNAEDVSAAYDAAIAAQQQIINSGGIDISGAVKSVLFEIALDSLGTGISYVKNSAKKSAAAQSEKTGLDPKKSNYFKDAKSADDAKNIYLKLVRQHHPDRFATESQEVQNRETAVMQDINREYEQVGVFFTNRDVNAVASAYEDAAQGKNIKSSVQSVRDALTRIFQTIKGGGKQQNIMVAQQIISAAEEDISRFASVPVTPSAATVTESPAQPVTPTQTPVTSTPATLGPIASDFVQAGFSQKVARVREQIMDRLATDGMNVSDRDIDRLNPTSPLTRQIFSAHYGVQFPDNLKSIDKQQLYAIYRSPSVPMESPAPESAAPQSVTPAPALSQTPQTVPGQTAPVPVTDAAQQFPAVNNILNPQAAPQTVSPAPQSVSETTSPAAESVPEYVSPRSPMEIIMSMPKDNGPARKSPSNEDVDKMFNPRAVEEITTNAPATSDNTAAQYLINAEEYNRVRKQYPGYLTGIETDGELILFYGSDASKVAKIFDTKIITEDVPGLGETQITGVKGRAYVLGKLVSKRRGSGYKVVIAAPDAQNPDAPYEIVKVRDKQKEKQQEREAIVNQMIAQAEAIGKEWDAAHGIDNTSAAESIPESTESSPNAPRYTVRKTGKSRPRWLVWDNQLDRAYVPSDRKDAVRYQSPDAAQSAADSLNGAPSAPETVSGTTQSPVANDIPSGYHQPVSAADSIAPAVTENPQEVSSNVTESATGPDGQLTDTTPAQTSPEQTTEAVHVGRATTIYHPYQGTVPVQTQSSGQTVTVPSASIQTARDRINQAMEMETSGQRGFLATLSNLYRKAFRQSSNVPVIGATYQGNPYSVNINKTVPSKVISSQNFSAEKLSLLDILPEIVHNSEYVGSGQYVQHGNKKREVLRYDYFETPVSIENTNYIARFDVEVLPGTNNYRTHQIVKMDLTRTEARLPAPIAGPSSDGSSPSADSVTQPPEVVNTKSDNSAPKAVSESPTAEATLQSAEAPQIPTAPEASETPAIAPADTSQSPETPNTPAPKSPAKSAAPDKVTAAQTKAAIKRVVKDTMNSPIRGMFEQDGKFWATNGKRVIRMNQDSPELNHADRAESESTIQYVKERIDEILSGVSTDSTPVSMPSIAELKEFIKQGKTAFYDLSNGTRVNAKYLLDMLQALPGATVYSSSATREQFSPLYFSAKNGDGILLPVRPPDANAPSQNQPDQTSNIPADNPAAPESNSESLAAEPVTPKTPLEIFTSDMDPKTRGRVMKTLEKKFRYQDYGVLTRAEAVEKRVADGWTPRVEHDVSDYKRNDKWNADEKTKPHTVYSLEGEIMHEGEPVTVLETITKTEYDYANFLINRSAADTIPAPASESSAAQTDIQPAETSVRAVDEEKRAQKTVAEQQQQEVRQKTDQALTTTRNNFIIPADGLKAPTTPKTRAKSNIAAIQLMQSILADDRAATPDEQLTLAQYTGWGGVSDIFDDRKSDWQSLREQLRSILSDTDFAAARASILNAYYTDPDIIRAVYSGLEHLGFSGGRLLDPSTGIGHFAGSMPDTIRASTQLTMIELDSVSGNIAKLLYPAADVRVQGFQDAKLPNDYFDAAVSNVPFGSNGVYDPDFKKAPKAVTSSIHNYFFAKALQKVRPGGVVAFITSSSTMDAQTETFRQYLMKHADLLGAVRLPNTAFKNTGTGVVSDILILQKRAPNTPYHGETFLKQDRFTINRDVHYMNQYFMEHPDMVLGTPELRNGPHGLDTTWNPRQTKTPLPEQIQLALQKINGKISYPDRNKSQSQIRKETRAAPGKNGGIVRQGGKLYRNQDGVLREVSDIQQKDLPRMDAIVSLRDAARSLLNLQINNAPSAKIDAARRALNALYDDFRNRFGNLHTRSNKQLVTKDADSPFILALENVSDSGKVSKADIFSGNTVTPAPVVTHADSVADALAVSISETGTVDPARIAQLTGLSRNDAQSQLLEQGLAFLNRDGGLEIREKYLSGNVRAKLHEAEALAAGNPDYQRNVDALRDVLPKDVAPEDINVSLGETWIPETVYSRFAVHMLTGAQAPSHIEQIRIYHNPHTGKWYVDLKPGDYWTGLHSRLRNDENIKTWGTEYNRFLGGGKGKGILEATLNGEEITVTRDGVTDQTATAAAREKQKKVREEFSRWWKHELLKDPNTRETLTRLYNDTFNNFVRPRYDGSALSFPGMASDITMRDYQKNGIYRAIMEPSILFAHAVGTGKTWTIAATAMEYRRLGIARKPMIVVEANLLGQWERDFRKLYPAAKLLTVQSVNRKETVNRIATGDFDAVIIGQDALKKIPMSAAFRIQFYAEQITALEFAIQEANANGEDKKSVRDMEGRKDRLRQKMKALENREAKDTDNIDWESLGVDALFIDESQDYKNLFFHSGMKNVYGIGSKDGNQRTLDMYMKLRHMRETGGRFAFATGTPVLNSMSEIYSILRYFREPELHAMGIYSFDSWAAQFADIKQVIGVGVNGKFRTENHVIAFKNAPQLSTLIGTFMDVQLSPPQEGVPKMKGNQRRIVECEPSQGQLEQIQEIRSLANDPKYNRLALTTMLRKVAYTQRMLDPSLPYEPDGKIMKCVDDVYQTWLETADQNGTQLIFCDMAVPKATRQSETGEVSETGEDEESKEPESKEALQIYQDMKDALTQKGIPANQIAFIHDAHNPDQRNKLAQKFRDGEIRVLIGSRKKMGVGLNLQTRIAAMNNLDAPWRPGDVTQADGRALRFGNIFPEVEFRQYVTKQTGDHLMWTKVAAKAQMILDFFSGQSDAQYVELGDDALSFAEIQAAASGDPRTMELFRVGQDIAHYEALERAHMQDVFAAQDNLKKAQQAIASDTAAVETLRKDIAKRQDIAGKNFSMTVGKSTFANRADAGKALLAEVQKHLKPSPDTEKTFPAGSFAGLDMLVTNNGDILLRGNGTYRRTANLQSATGTVAALQNAVQGLDDALSQTQQRIAQNQDAIPNYQKTIRTPFEYEGKLDSLRQKQEDIKQEIIASNPDAASRQDVLSDQTDMETAERSAIRSMKNATTSKSAATRRQSVRRATETRNGKMPSHPENWTAEQIKTSQEVLEQIRKEQPQSVKELTDIINGVKKPELSDIIENIRHAWGIIPGRGVQITTGHTIPGNLGQYDERSHGIRTRTTNDLPTLSHELGHHIDNLYQFTNAELSAESLQELVDNLPEDFPKDKYKPEELAGEGMAEFVRRFLQNRETAYTDYPKTYAQFMQTLSGRDQAQILADSIRVNTYFADAPVHFPERGDPVPDRRTVLEKAGESRDYFVQKALDSLDPIRRLSNQFDDAYDSDVYQKFYNLAYSESKAMGILQGDLYGIDGKWLAPGLQTALRGVDFDNRQEYEDFAAYLTAQRATTLLPREIRVYANDAQNTVEYASQQISALEKKYPKFRMAADNLRQFWHNFGQEYFVKSGLMSQDLFDRLEAVDSYYAPFQRVIEKAGKRRGRKPSNPASVIQRIKGSGKDIYNPVDNMIMLIPRIITLAMDNAAKVELTEIALTSGIDATWMEKIPAPVRKITADVSGKYARIQNELADSFDKEQMDTLLEAMEKSGELMDVWIRANPGKDTLIIYRDGKPEYWKINDHLLFDALAQTDRTIRKGIAKVWSSMTREFTQNVTGRFFIWSLTRNWFSDLQQAEIRSMWGNHLKLLPEMAKTYGNYFRETWNLPNVDPLHLEWVAMGGMNMFDGASPYNKKLAKQVRRAWTSGNISVNPLVDIARFSEWIGKAVENGPREATYVLFRQRGLEPYQAFRAAMEITTDFKISGEWGRDFNVMFPFFNAQVQGTAQNLGTLLGKDVPKSQRGKVIRQRVTAFLAMSLISSMFNYILNNLDDGDKEEYQHMSTFVKNSYWMIPKFWAGHGHLALRKPREIAIPASYFERLIEYWHGQNEHALDDFFRYAVNEAMPSVLADLALGDVQTAIGDFTVLGAIHNLGMNRDFLGRPIVSAALEDLAPHLQYNGKTSALAKNIADVLSQIGIEVSPMQMDYFNANGMPVPLFGSVYQYMQKLFPVDPNLRDWTVGIASTFSKDSLYSNDIVNWTYEQAQKSSTDAKSYPTDMDKQIRSKTDDAIKTFYSRYYSIAKNDSETGESRALRAMVLDDLYRYRDIVEHDEVSRAQQAVYDVCRAAGETSELLPTARTVTVKDANGVIYSLTAKQYYDYNGYYNRTYWETAEKALPLVSTDEQRTAVLQKAEDAARDMSKSYALSLVGGPNAKPGQTNKFDTLALYQIDVADYVALQALTKDIESYPVIRNDGTVKTDENGQAETQENSRAAQIREVIENAFDSGMMNYPDDQKKKLMELLGVNETVRKWSLDHLRNKLENWRGKQS